MLRCLYEHPCFFFPWPLFDYQHLFKKIQFKKKNFCHDSIPCSGVLIVVGGIKNTLLYHIYSSGRTDS